jgi:hypothetical protein
MIAADSGIAAAPLPETMFGNTAVGEREEAPEMARGGIVAFAKGNKVEAKPDDVAALRALDPLKAFRTETERAKDIETSIEAQEKFLGPDKSVEIAERLAKSSEFSPESEAMSKAGAAFEAMQAFGEPGTFASGLGKAGAIVGRNVKELEKLKRDAKREADKLRLETARYERLDKRGKYAEAQKSADRIAGIQQNLYALDAAKTEKLAGIQMQEKQMQQTKELTLAQIAATRAGQFSLDKELAGAELQRGIEDYRAKYGKDPAGKDLADIRATAFNKAAEMRRIPYGGPAGLDIKIQSEITDRIKADPELKRLENQLEIAGYKKDNQAEIASLTAQINNRRQVIVNEIQQGVRPTAGAGGAGSAGAGVGAKPQPGQIFTDASGNRAKYIGGDPRDPKSYQPV